MEAWNCPLYMIVVDATCTSDDMWYISGDAYRCNAGRKMEFKQKAKKTGPDIGTRVFRISVLSKTPRSRHDSRACTYVRDQKIRFPWEKWRGVMYVPKPKPKPNKYEGGR
jgi:hypothetical protein